MRPKDTFDILLLIARPAAGKSEIIDYLKRTALEGRVRRFHIGEFGEIDDFPMLWSWFEEDALLAEMGYLRLHTDAESYFLGSHLWDLLVRRICLEYRKQLRPAAGKVAPATTILEFSRGKEHGGYASAYANLSHEVVEKLAIVYVNVSWAESLRKNRQRFNPQRPDSILEHGLSDDGFSFTQKAGTRKIFRGKTMISWKDSIKRTTGARSVRLTRTSSPSRGGACRTWFSRMRMTSPPAAATRWVPGWRSAWDVCGS
jgi:hypothetical protein